MLAESQEWVFGHRPIGDDLGLLALPGYSTFAAFCLFAPSSKAHFFTQKSIILRSLFSVEPLFPGLSAHSTTQKSPTFAFFLVVSRGL